MSWTLSCLQFRKFYHDVELITDQEGYDLFINKLGLPYTRTEVVLDKLNDYDADLWALGKVYAYSMQDEPFIHADGDVFIWGRFSSALENAEVFAQNFECDFNYYRKAYQYANANFRFVPEAIHREKKQTTTFNGVNAGIIGGKNIPFFKEYTALAMELVDKNIDRMDNLDKGMFNTFYEQHLFYCLSYDRELEIHFAFDNVNEQFDGLVDFTGAPSNSRYVHTITGHKKRQEIAMLLEFRLKTMYPESYYKIIELLKNHSI
jgi:hypothetical protein